MARNKTVQPPPTPPEIIKSPLDSNSYKLFRLPNGLRVMLTSTIYDQIDLENPTIRAETIKQIDKFNRHFVNIPDKLQPQKSKSNGGCGKNEKGCSRPKKQKLDLPEKCSSRSGVKKSHYDIFNGIATLVIGVGAFHDPKDVPGMAHFCEHSITFGSKKYPEKKALQSLIKSNGGAWRAVTYQERTLFSFNTQVVKGLDELQPFIKALDILSDTMTNPLMPADWIRKEVHAVDSEFLLGRLGDIRRFRQILRGCATDLHPVQNFSTGNFQTLNHENIHQRLCDWMIKYYAADNMTLDISAPKSIRELEKLVLQYFSRIPSRIAGNNSPRDELLKNFSHTPYDTDRFRSFYQVVPSSDTQWLSICWELPAQMWQDYETKPLSFIGFLFREGSTIAKCLREKHLSLGLDVNSQYSSIFSSVLQIQINLTDPGLRNLNQVIKIIFSYLKSLLNTSSALMLEEFNKFRRLQANSFHFHKQFNSFEANANLATRLQFVENDRHILTSYSLVSTFNHRVILSCIKMLKPEMANIVVFSKLFLTKYPSLVEPWYKTKYNLEKLSSTDLRRFRNVQIFKSLEFPAIHLYKLEIPKSIISPNGNPPLTNLMQTNRASLIYSNGIECSEIRIPHAVYEIRILSYMYNFQTPLKSVFMKLWKNMLSKHLETILNMSTIFWYELELLKGTGFLLTLNGPATGMLPEILKSILDEFESFGDNMTQDDFDDYQNSHIKRYANNAMRADFYCDDFLNFLVLQNHILFDQKKSILKSALLYDFIDFIYKFKSRMFIAGELRGCILSSKANQVMEILNRMSYCELPMLTNISNDRAMQLPLGENCLCVNGRNSDNSTSIILNYYQFGNLNHEDKQRVCWLAHIMRFPAFLQLRTTEQLSYFVSVDFEEHCNVYGISFSIKPQSSKYSSGYIDDRIDNFIATFYYTLSDLLTSNDMSIQADDLTRFNQLYANYLLSTGKDFRKISIQILGTCPVIRSRPPTTRSVSVMSSNIAKAVQSKSNEKRDKNIKSDALPTMDLNIDYNVPQDSNSNCGGRSNVYFITDIDSFKSDLYAYPMSNY